jgi:hypothetical protein
VRHQSYLRELLLRLDMVTSHRGLEEQPSKSHQNLSREKVTLDGSNQLVVSTRIHSVLFDRIAAYTEVA